MIVHQFYDGIQSKITSLQSFHGSVMKAVYKKIVLS